MGNAGLSPKLIEYYPIGGKFTNHIIVMEHILDRSGELLERSDEEQLTFLNKEIARLVLGLRKLNLEPSDAEYIFDGTNIRFIDVGAFRPPVDNFDPKKVFSDIRDLLANKFHVLRVNRKK